MLLALIRKEIVGHVLTLRFAVTFALILALVFISMFVAVRDYQQRVEQHDLMRREAKAQLDELAKPGGPEGASRLASVFYQGKLDAVPVPPLSSVVRGLSDATPAAIFTSGGRSRNVSMVTQANPLGGLYHRPDLIYAVSVMLSLLAILFMFDTVCGEKESGTLRLMLANAVPRHDILLSKWIGGFLVLSVPFTIFVAGGLAYAWASGALVFDEEQIQRLGLLMLASLLYLSVFFTLGLLVSACTHRSSTALFVCLFIWVGWILVVPNLAPVMAKIIAPAPSKQKIEEQKQAKAREIGLRKSRLALVSGELGYSEKLNLEEAKLDKELEQWQTRWDRHYDNSIRRQIAWAENLGRISPSASLVYASTALSQTGPQAYQQFGEARQQLRTAISAKLQEIQQEARRNNGGWPQVRPEEVPVLSVRAPTMAQSLEHAMNDMLILVILNVVFFMAAFTAFLRYDAR